MGLYKVRTVHMYLSRASLNGHNFSSVGPITLILRFSESLGRGLSDDVLKSKVPVFDKILWPIAMVFARKWEIMARSKFGI